MDRDAAALLYDVIIVGGGPAGLSAALMLGRCRRRVLVCDEGKPRNRVSSAMHGYLSRDGTPPQEFLRLGREELLRYDVDYRNERVARAEVGEGRFRVHLDDGQCFESRKLLLCTGVEDKLPDLEGIGSMYGRSVWHCPYCDGWEVRDQALAAYGKGEAGAALAIKLRIWTQDVVLCLDGGALEPDLERRLERNGVGIRPERIARLEGADGQLARIVFCEGPPLERQGLFFTTGQRQRAPLADMLGCEFNPKGTVITDPKERTNVPGLFLAGDASDDVQFVIVAAAEGAIAALAINEELHEEEMEP
jgi:thioredoxin reductase